MKLLLHIVRKDAARIRWLWLAWIGVLVAKVGVGVVLERGLAVDCPYSLLENLHGGLVAIDVVATYFLAAWLVMEDAPMRTNHYARTRPVSRGRMLAAKMLGAFILLGLTPTLAWLPWWLYCDLGMLDCLRETALTMVVQGLLVLPAFLVGSLVDSFRRLLLWTPVWIGALVVAFFIPVMTLATREDIRRLLKDPEQLGLWQTSFQIAGGGLLLICVGLVFWQALRRRPRETVAVLAATWTAAMAWVCCSSLNLWPWGGEWAEDQPENARSVEVRLASATLVPSPYPPQPLDRLLLHWQPSTPPGLEIIPLKTRATFRNGDDSKVIGPNLYHVGASDFGEASRLLKYIDFSKMPQRPDNPKVDGRMAQSRYYHYLVKIRSETGFPEEIWRSEIPGGLQNNLKSIVLRSQMLFAQIKHEMIGLVPLEQSSWRLGEARGLRLTRVGRWENGASVTGIARGPRALPLHPLIKFFAPLANHRAEESFTNDGVALVDSWNRRELPIQSFQWLTHRGLVIGGVSLRTFGFQADPGNVWRNGQWLFREKVTDEWFNGLRVAVVKQPETARFYREVTVDPLPITSADESPRQQ